MSKRKEWWYYLPINPQGWAVGPLAVKRMNNKLIPFMGRNQELHMFKETVKEELFSRYGALIPVDEDVELCVYAWQRLDEYRSATGRKSKDKFADLTNIVKAAEDAIQGVLIKNDNRVMAQRNVIMDRSPSINGCLVICLRTWEGPNPDEIPQHIWDRVDIEDHEPDMGANQLNLPGELPF